MSILFCTPCYGGSLTEPHFRSAMRLKEVLTQIGVVHDWLTGKNESLVHRGRMEMTASFLRGDFTHMMWLDADIGFEAEDVAKLWNLQVDVAVGVYAMKKADACWYSAWRGGKLVRVDELGGPTAVDYAGTGFMLLSRAAIERVQEHLLRRHVTASDALERLQEQLSDEEYELLSEMVDAQAPEWSGASGRVPSLYMTPIFDDGLESEDYFFCRMAREAGLEIVMEPTVRLQHWGQASYPLNAA